MKKFFFSHPDVILATIAIVLLVLLVGFFSWGINNVVFNVQKSTVSPASQNQQGFDLQDAARLDFKGLSTSTPSSSDGSAPMVSTTTTIIATTTDQTSTIGGKK